MCFFSASSVGDFQQLYDFGIRESLVSYFYIKKNLPYWDEMLPKFKEEGGIFMTDSGAFSFFGLFNSGSPEYAQMETEEFWLPYLKEYISWIRAHKECIFSCANLDLDFILGYDVVDRWNKEYFEPLERETGVQVVYVVHENKGRVNADISFMQRLRQYCERYNYIGANQAFKHKSAYIYQMVKKYNIRIHGFAWTDLPLLRKQPFFSVDSVTWLGGVRFGITYDYDGKNFRSYEGKQKYIRKSRRIKYEKEGIDFSMVTQKEDRKSINRMNLLGWMGFRHEYLKVANIKLHTKSVRYYEDNRGIDRKHPKAD